MKTKNLFALTSIVCWLSSAAFVGAQVNPPPTTLPGERTMKTLQQIEPRTPIASLPYMISQPGSYYLENNLVGVPNQSGLTIASDNVTVDLNGFELRGISNSFSGIYISNTHYGVVIRNGALCQWGNYGINGMSARNLTVTDVRASDNGNDGLNLGEGGTVRDCLAFNNRGDGIQVGQRSRVLNSAAYSNAVVGIRAVAASTIQGCTAATNRAEGILVSELCRVVGNVCDQNNYGIHATGAGNRIEENHTSRNTAKGFKVDLQYGQNVVVKNSAYNTLNRVSDYNYDVAIGNLFGPVVDSWGLNALRNVYPENHAWANFGDPVTIY